MKARIHQCHPPRFRIIVVNLHTVAYKVKGHIGGVKEIVGKILFYHILLVSQTDYKIMIAKLGIIFHYVP